MHTRVYTIQEYIVTPVGGTYQRLNGGAWMAADYVELGDHLYLQESTGQGWLHGTGRAELSRSGLAVLYVDPYEHRNVRTSIFILRHQQTWTHLIE